MQSPKRERKAWHLKPADFDTRKVYAEQDWRFQLFFEYLRISPSYSLATTCENEEQLAHLLGDTSDAAAVWKTYRDVGDVFGVLYRQWWLSRGLGLFGIKSARPRVEKVMHLSAKLSLEEQLATISGELGQFIQTRYTEQGKPGSLLVSIPLGLKRATVLTQLKLLLDAHLSPAASTPQSVYELEKNKMRQSRLLAGLRLVYMKAARPTEELWRVAARARISKAHGSLDPNSAKKDAKSGVARRMMTIMASRLMHDTLVLAENAARGAFPSLQPVPTVPFQFEQLGKRLSEVSRIEKDRKAGMAGSTTPANVKRIDVTG